MTNTLEEINNLIANQSQFIDPLLSEVEKVIVGQKAVMERILIALLANGHVLLEGVPGLAKTLMITTLSKVIDADFHRIQFTPDLLPSDITGSLMYDQTEKTFIPRKGPIFAHLILADEINRAPAKVQSALLEAMQERQVTIGDTSYALSTPFLVLATQNPIEQDGTYPLPEAQVDRFLMKLKITYPARDEERIIIQRMTGEALPDVMRCVSPHAIMEAQACVSKIYVDDKIREYILDIVGATREPEKFNLKELKPLIEFGASPRASIALVRCAQARAFMKHRGFVTPDDVKAICREVLRHRIMVSFEAEAEQIDSDALIDRILAEIIVP